ncbi:MAG: hypothetical protein H7X84_01795 [Verrucomicrobia bacterium]|nr:hypothetical protein [Prolixibacteraceae bacterium]
MNIKINKNGVCHVLAFLMLIVLLNSAYFFLVLLKLSLVKWLAFNACSIAITTYLLCFVLFQWTKKDYLLAIPLLPLYYYGTMGLFIMPWNEANLFAQITHVVITMNVLWLLYLLLKERKLEPLGKGVLIGILFFVPIFAYIQTYTQLHMNEFMQLLQKM